MSRVDIRERSSEELFRLFDEVMDELLRRGVVRTRNNPVADYAEWLVASALGLRLQTNSNKGWDAEGADGSRYQIKARRLKSGKGSRQLSAIRSLDANSFHHLVAVLFDSDFSILEAYIIPHDIIGDYARFSSHVNGHLLRLKGTLLTAPGVTRVDHILRQYLQRCQESNTDSQHELI